MGFKIDEERIKNKSYSEWIDVAELEVQGASMSINMAKVYIMTAFQKTDKDEQTRESAVDTLNNAINAICDVEQLLKKLED